jgi:DNA-binding transcriptional regulator YiaG
MTTKKARIAKASLGADGKLRRLNAAGKPGRVLRGRTDAAKLNSAAAFAPDADTPILTRRELRELRPVTVGEAPDVASVRRRLRLSQGAFAQLFGIPLATLKDWEQNRRSPDAPARAYLRVIAQDPKAVRRALEAAE